MQLHGQDPSSSPRPVLHPHHLTAESVGAPPVAHETYLRAAYDIILSHRKHSGRTWKMWAIILAVFSIGGFAANGIAGVVFLLGAYGCWVMYTRRRPVRVSGEDVTALNSMYPNHGAKLAITRHDESKDGAI